MISKNTISGNTTTAPDDPFYSILNIDDNSQYDSVTSDRGEYVIEFPSTENCNIIFPAAINLFVNPVTDKLHIEI